MLAQKIRVSDWGHDVEHAAYDEPWLRNFVELGKTLSSACFPRAKCGDLSLATSGPDIGSPILSTL